MEIFLKEFVRTLYYIQNCPVVAKSGWPFGVFVQLSSI